MTKSLFIAFEGIDGVGKTTQIKILGEKLHKAQLEVCYFREPGATQIGKKIREILLDPETINLESKTEALLFFADRIENISKNILPALKSGKIVLQDRFTASTISYQSGGRGLDFDKLTDISNWLTEDLTPDITILLKGDVDKMLARAKLKTGGEDRIEAESREFYQNIQDCYLKLAKGSSNNWLILNADEEVEGLAEKIYDYVSVKLNE